MDDLISRQAAIDSLGERPMVWMDSDYEIAQRNQWDADKLAIETVPSAQPEQRWNRLMMYLADLQLAYSPNWGSNGCGDEKLYEFVTGLFEELQGWEEG